ncbi:MAG: 2-amino-4-hydroxy-6-hydroxymethyldihydropteridine diphosphokinase, partial [Muribaculaceae bacterium]|nr:2-amino-4-hydroxy-6-hydroxymethyldihydropteridine diphosphokinase [Muribaculaceae bacterium]
MMRLHLNIGSNSGNRRARIRAAIAAVGLFIDRHGGRISLSAPVRSEPWGYYSPNEFLNIGLMIDLPGVATVGRLEEILAHLQAIERAICPAPHRNPDGTYRDREIDIDIIAADIPVST